MAAAGTCPDPLSTTPATDAGTSASEQITSGVSAEESGSRPCEPLTYDASSGTVLIAYRRPTFFFTRLRPAFAFASRSAGSKNSSAGS